MQNVQVVFSIPELYFALQVLYTKTSDQSQASKDEAYVEGRTSYVTELEGLQAGYTYTVEVIAVSNSVNSDASAATTTTGGFDFMSSWIRQKYNTNILNGNQAYLDVALLLRLEAHGETVSDRE